MTKKEVWVARCWRVGVDIEQVEGERCPECGDPDGHRGNPTRVRERYDKARRAFLLEVQHITDEANTQARAALDQPHEHDYLMYLATNIGAIGESVATHSMLSFEGWKIEFCGGHRACKPVKELEDH